MMETIVGILGAATIGALGWVNHLGNRTSILETRQEDLLLLIETKLNNIDDRLRRIERKVLNGSYREED